MASAPNALTPPPGPNDSGTPPETPTAPVAASPAPATPAPGMQQGTQDLLQAVSILRGIAKAYPAASPIIQKINDLIPQVAATMMQHGNPGEPQSPPTGG